MWDALRLDVRHSFRGLRRAPGFSLIVVVTLTVAMGATTAVGSLLNGLFARKLPVPSPDELVALSPVDPQGNATGYIYADTFNAYRGAQRSIAQMAMYSGGGLSRVETPDGGFDANSDRVSANYLDVLGVQLSAGRFFTDSDDDAVVVITEAMRRRLFGDARGIGETIRIDAVPATVIGVVAEGFAGLEMDYANDLMRPLRRSRPAGANSSPLRADTVVGRLAHGVSVRAARAEAQTLWPSIQSATVPGTLAERERESLLHQHVVVEPLASGFSGLRDRYTNTLAMVLALMGLLLAVACANLAGLTLARSLTRRHQVAIRLALGGSARRVFWQLLLDGLLLSAVAFAGAVPIAWGLVRSCGRRCSPIP